MASNAIFPEAPALRPSPSLQFAGRAVGRAFRLVPRPLRFRLAQRFARAIEPAMQKTHVYRDRVRLGTDDLREISLEMVLLMLSRHGTEFDPIFEVRGGEVFDDLGGRGALIVSAHLMLGTMVLRYLEDRGQPAYVITTDHTLPIPGRRTLAHVIQAPSSNLPMKVRNALRQGRIVAAAIDRGVLVSAEGERRNVAIEVPGRTMLVSEALVRVAVRVGARVIFLAGQMDANRKVVLQLTPAPEHADVAVTLHAFAEFVRAAVARTAL